MDIFLGLAGTVLREGFIYSLMAMGVFITYKILDFPDLSVDGTFPLGACISAALITFGVNPWITLILAFLGGGIAGFVTGFLHVKFRITNLLSGILIMTALWSVNLIITGGKAVFQFFNKPTIFNSGPIMLLPESMAQYRKLVLVFILAILLKLALDWFLKTRAGLLLRAGGDNNQFVSSLGRDPGLVKIVGLTIGNGCTALSGSVLAQMSEHADINSGKGMVVMGLAAVIIGTSLFQRFPFIKGTTMAIFGAIIYKMGLQIALSLGLPPSYLKLLMAVLLTLALVTREIRTKAGKNEYAY